jgi:hypothetical protein
MYANRNAPGVMYVTAPDDSLPRSIYRSFDAGATWELRSLAIVSERLADIAFSRKRPDVVLSVPSDGFGNLNFSSDGGAAWNHVETFDASETHTEASYHGLVAPQFGLLNSNRWLRVTYTEYTTEVHGSAYGRLISESIDDSHSDTISLGGLIQAGDIKGLGFVPVITGSLDVGIAGDSDLYLLLIVWWDGALYHSTDAGHSWLRLDTAVVNTPERWRWSLHSFIPAPTAISPCFVVMDTLLSDSSDPAHPSRIFALFPGAPKWVPVFDADSAMSSSLSWNEMERALYFIAGKSLYRWQGPPNAVREPTSASPIAVEIVESYPNPASAQTTITYRSGAHARARIRILDALGREAALASERSSTGIDRELRIDLSSLPSGIYVCEIAAEGSVARREIAVMR